MGERGGERARCSALCSAHNTTANRDKLAGEGPARVATGAGGRETDVAARKKEIIKHGPEGAEMQPRGEDYKQPWYV